MISTPHHAYRITDRSYEGVAKRDVRLLATQLGFSVRKLGEIDIIVAELTSNLVKYAAEGELLVRPIVHTTNPGLELIGVDSGPGMADPVRMMQDGVSTGGSLGQGLGAINRLADLFQLYSLPERGTIGLVRVFQKKVVPAPAASLAAVQAVIVPKPGETACGDGFFCRLTTTSLKVFLGDGLGHGASAQEAVQLALRTMEQQRSGNPAGWLTALHRATVGTRGLVGTAAQFDFASRMWSLCGVGNIRTQLSGTHSVRSYAAQSGILGYNLPRSLIGHEYAYEPGQCLVMASDGVQSRWNPARYPGVNRYDPSVLAAIIYKEYARQTDDRSVMVARIG